MFPKKRQRHEHVLRNSIPKSAIGLYPGTFDPVTLGHLDIIKRAVKLVDHLVIGVATNPSKAPIFTLDERHGHGEARPSPSARVNGRATIEVETFDSLLVKFAEEVGAGVIIRGLRAVSDFEYEFQMVAMNQRLNSEIETVFLMADPRHQAIASRLVKEIALLGGDVAPFTTPPSPSPDSNAARKRNNGRRHPIPKIP
jgi:pantetheine-phosphate adenylyltransferase